MAWAFDSSLWCCSGHVVNVSCGRSLLLGIDCGFLCCKRDVRRVESGAHEDD